MSVHVDTDATAQEPPIGDGDTGTSRRTRDDGLVRAEPGWTKGLALVSIVGAIVPILVAAGRAIAKDWVPVGDNAFFALRAQDVLTDQHPLLGTWTSASLTVGVDMNNPGPLLFDALALPVKLGGDAGLAAGVALINIAAIAGMAIVARRQAGNRGVIVAMAAAAGLGWAMGSELLFDPWQPNSLLFPALCFFFLVWALACGDFVVLPWTVGVASVIVQTHIGYALLVPALGAWGAAVAAGQIWRSRRNDPAGWPRRRQRLGCCVVAACVVGVVWWSQPLYEQFFVAGRGNLGRLASSLGVDQETVGARLAPRLVAEVVALPPWWGRPSLGSTFGTGTSLPSVETAVVAVGLVGAVLIAAVLVARRLGDAPGVVAASTGVVSLGVAVLAAMRIPIELFGGVVPHHLLWLWPLAVFITFGLVLPLTAGLGGRGRLAALTFLAAAAVTLGALNLPAMNARIGPTADADQIPIVRELVSQMAPLREERGVLVDLRGQRFAEPYSTPIMLELERLGVPWFVNEPGLLRQIGPDRAYEGGASVRLFFREDDAARQIPPGARRVALVDRSSDTAVAIFTEPLEGD